MPKRAVTYSLDVEATGPIPGPWWMCSLAVCRTEDVERSIHRELKPLELPGVSQPERADAMEVVAAGLSDVDWDASRPAEENLARVRGYFVSNGLEPLQAIREIDEWIRTDVGEDRPVIVGSPVTFDFMWIYWYWWFCLDAMPPFGFSGLDVRSYFMGSHGVDFMGTGKARYLKHYPNEYEHTHHPLDDARQQGRIWQDMVDARKARGKL